MPNPLVEKLTKIISGEVKNDLQTLRKYSHDASIFEVTPRVVVFPKNVEDVEKLVNFVREKKSDDSSLSLTARSAGTDMTGGPLNDSIIVDFQKYFTKFISLKDNIATAQPGIFYRDFEKQTIRKKLIFPAYPASREICSIGGMVNNNAGGEKTLKWGKIEDYIYKVKVVLADGHEYSFCALDQKELERKIKQGNYEGKIYKKIYKLVIDNASLLKAAKPQVSKNSAGYFLWNIYDPGLKTFDLTRLFVGAQGTLGLVTEVSLGLTPVFAYSQMVVIYMDKLDKLAELINTVLPHGPESFETYDDHTFKLAVRYFTSFAKQMGVKNIFKFTWHFLPDIWKVVSGRVPKLVLQVEFAANEKGEIDKKVKTLLRELKPFGVEIKIAKDKKSQKKYWLFRRESFNLLRHKIVNRQVAPFVEDFAVRPEYLPKFLPELDNIFKKYPLTYTIAGHIGDGNFHIMPLMNLRDSKQRDLIPIISRQIYDLVLKYKGTITAEHNDGLIRSPFLKQMYGDKVYDLFRKTKQIFDPENIFNPNKKIGVEIHDAMSKIRVNWD